ncbi:MAG: efflux RND transporter permease subunit, partial [Sphingobacteriales bacterium]
ILLCILAVFAPAFTMSGIPGSLFLPLASAIGFSMIISFLLSQTFVPVMANWLMKPHAQTHTEATEQKKVGKFDRFRNGFLKFIDKLFMIRKPVTLVYLVGVTSIAALCINTIGRDVFPKVNSSQFQLRMRAAAGTRVERTEEQAKLVLNEIYNIAGKDHVSISSAYVGQHPSLFSINPIYLFTAGPHEAVFQVAFKDNELDLEAFKDQLRDKMHKVLPDVKLSFEPIELTDKVLSQGASTPIEIRVSGKVKKLNEEYALKLVDKLKQTTYLRDVQIAQPVSYPALNVNIDRVRAAQLGVDVTDISRSLVASTSSSRYTEKNNWIDERSGQSYSVQVQVPLDKMRTQNDINEIPLLRNQSRPVLGDVATIYPGTTHGENDNMGAIPYVSVTANISKMDLGTAVKDTRAHIASLGELPRGLFVEQFGMGTVLEDTMGSLQSGLLIAVVVIFLMLAANFQSFKVSFVVLTTVPAVVLGSLLLLFLTGSTLNLQSYMGIIMSVGVSIANAVLLVTNAEQLRLQSSNAIEAAREAASVRLRPIIMTSIAMIAGMLPMAIGHGEGGDQVSPLGRAVIGGLLFSTFAVLVILPMIFAWVQGNASTQSVSLDPEDEQSKFYVAPEHSHS